MTQIEAIIWMQQNWHPRIGSRKNYFESLNSVVLYWNDIPDAVLSALGSSTSFVPYLMVYNEKGSDLLPSDQATFLTTYGYKANANRSISIYVGTAGDSPFLPENNTDLASAKWVGVKGTYNSTITINPLMSSTTLNSFKTAGYQILDLSSITCFSTTSYKTVVNWYADNLETIRFAIFFVGLTHAYAETYQDWIYTNVLCYDLCST